MPKAKEITIKLNLDEAKDCLKHLPENLEKLRAKIEEAIKLLISGIS